MPVLTKLNWRSYKVRGQVSSSKKTRSDVILPGANVLQVIRNAGDGETVRIMITRLFK